MDRSWRDCDDRHRHPHRNEPNENQRSAGSHVASGHAAGFADCQHHVSFWHETWLLTESYPVVNVRAI